MGMKRNTLYNIIGSLLPLVVSLVTVPMYLKYIGVERYGVLAIVWMLLGYFGFFDLGLPRATANQIARMHDASPTDRQEVIWTALALNALFGLLGSVAIYLAVPPLLEHVFEMDPHLRVEVIGALPWLALAIPVATVTGVMVGALEGRERFLIVNFVQVSSTALFQVIPLAVAIFYDARLQWVVAAAIIVRVLTIVMLYASLAREFPDRLVRPDVKWVKPLLGYGGWVSVSWLVLPVLESFDRFIIGAMLGAKSVAVYTVPFNLVSRLRVLPVAINRTLFPKLSAMDNEEAGALALRAINLLVALFTPLIVAGIFLIKPFMILWVGNEIAQESWGLATTFMIGIWLNSLAHIPFNLLEARGQPDRVAKLQLLELPVFTGLLWLGAREWGLQGVALAWTIRVWLDANILFLMTGMARQVWRQIWLGASLVIAAWCLAFLSPDGVLLPFILTLATVIWAWTKDPTLRKLATTGCASCIAIVYRKRSHSV